jgi:hypothetical protein
VSEQAGEPTEPFLLDRATPRADAELDSERISLDPEGAIPLVRRSEPVPPEATEATEVAPVDRVLDRAGRRGLRFLKQSLLVHGTLLAAVGIASCLRVARIGWSAPELVVGGLGFVLALPCFLSARTLWRLGRTPDAHLDAQKFAQGIAHLRAMFVLRATLLFTTLAVSCFAFSLIAAFIASL